MRGLRASGGASLGGYRYSAFGQTLEDTTSITQPLRWKARWFSPVAGGTYDVRARQWSPELGIFLSVDEFRYHHPAFLEGSDEAQRRVLALQGRHRTWYAGAWTRFGFHEDGLASALAVARGLGVEAPWSA